MAKIKMCTQKQIDEINKKIESDIVRVKDLPKKYGLNVTYGTFRDKKYLGVWSVDDYNKIMEVGK